MRGCVGWRGNVQSEAVPEKKKKRKKRRNQRKKENADTLNRDCDRWAKCYPGKKRMRGIKQRKKKKKREKSTKAGERDLSARRDPDANRSKAREVASSCAVGKGREEIQSTLYYCYWRDLDLTSHSWWKEEGRKKEAESRWTNGKEAVSRPRTNKWFSWGNGKLGFGETGAGWKARQRDGGT